MASEKNRSRPLSFSGRHVVATLVEDAEDLRATGVVTNLSETPMTLAGDVPGVIPKWKSTILRDGVIARAERVSVVHIPADENLGGVVFDGWQWFGDRAPEFPRSTPLYISPRDIAGEVVLDPVRFSNGSAESGQLDRYDIHLNLWWAPGNTDAVIHNTHAFLEIHTQIHGHGRIQIFRDREGTELYREISAAPGDTHDPIVQVTGLRTFRYPWHRGWTDTGAVWMAIELHPTGDLPPGPPQSVAGA